MQEKIEKALQTTELLSSDLREIYKGAIGKNDALVVLAAQWLDKVAKIRTALAQLEKV